MFAPDIVSLRQFYATRLGREVQAALAARLSEMWPPSRGDVTLGIGYCAPYVENLSASPVFLCMPAQQGAAYWPAGGSNRVFLSHESSLPLRENSVNRVLLMHSIEHSEQLSWMMQEAWRVLTPGGRLLAMVPNRHGLWSRSPSSPFGQGRPFSMAQLRDLVEGHDFSALRHCSTLLAPPWRIPALWRLARKAEKTGRWLWPFFGGVLMLEAEKQVYASVRQKATPAKLTRTPARTVPAMGSISRHCGEAKPTRQSSRSGAALDCRASLAMTKSYSAYLTEQP